MSDESFERYLSQFKVRPSQSLYTKIFRPRMLLWKTLYAGAIAATILAAVTVLYYQKESNTPLPNGNIQLTDKGQIPQTNVEQIESLSLVDMVQNYNLRSYALSGEGHLDELLSCASAHIFQKHQKGVTMASIVFPGDTN